MLWTVELEPEVVMWLDSLTPTHHMHVMYGVEMLAENPTTLGQPYSKHLGDGLRELRIRLHPNDVRVTYWLAPEERIVLLTVFTKSRQRETTEVERARLAMKRCLAGGPDHDHADAVYDRRI